MDAKIYKPSKNAMQSGRAGLKGWVLEYDVEAHKTPDPLMGWTQSDTTMEQVHLSFPSMEAAVDYAKKEGLSYRVLHERIRRVKPRNYGDNFKYVPPEKASKS